MEQGGDSDTYLPISILVLIRPAMCSGVRQGDIFIFLRRPPAGRRWVESRNVETMHGRKSKPERGGVSLTKDTYRQ